MNSLQKFPLFLLAAGALLVLIPHHQSMATKHAVAAYDSSCLVKTEANFDFTDQQRKKVIEVIENKVAGGIEEAGKITWENSPNATEYYQIVLKKGRVSIKYKGTECQDRLIWQDIEDCKAELKKLLGNQS
ncbi:hypothetical protein SAMN05660909_04413 [Chitinophaga terrae (ex Kim and Jung 2007)]|uniref:Uncharacterized protein n=1 Tax=Chitinophaga terrae (ex Kim and Jung 2007) TaxID=408074 RepID=A0A1H4FHZ5_9BACT|nr:hypothetical protein [Chitinophaga terrae (ex Kim and Jung 2007)]MDQ0105829.1 hypothetical protein [Chitinophaga terrae (ex Kim and Jung 2007)]SEA96916.1 hypothetical protein SAMN05660909_04413 [Chitinophaga terrae (ex Kim and Jung 2007)]